MFSWIINFFRHEESYDIFKPHEQKIYSYWNGKELVKADPITLYKRVMAKGPELSIDIKLANSISKDAQRGHDAMVESIRWIFHLEPLEKGGLTEASVIDLFDHFLIYTETLKKNMKTSPTSPMETLPSSESTSEGNPPISSMRASGSTVVELPTDVPKSSPLESTSPSASWTQESTTGVP